MIDDIYVKIKTTAVLFGIIFQAFYYNWVGQKIVDTSEKVFNSV